MFCAEESVTTLRRFSPELAIIPSLSASNQIKDIQPLLDIAHAFVFGPGLDANETHLLNAKTILSHVIRLNKPVVLYGNAIKILIENHKLVKGHKRCILLLHDQEFHQLYSAVIGKSQNDEFGESSNKENAPHHCGTTKTEDQDNNRVIELALALGGVTIAVMGAHDFITNGKTHYMCSIKSESDGTITGDTLSGMLGTFLHWATMETLLSSKSKRENKNIVLAGYAACFMLRKCEQVSHIKDNPCKSSDIIQCIGKVFQQYLEHEAGNKLFNQ